MTAIHIGQALGQLAGFTLVGVVALIYRKVKPPCRCCTNGDSCEPCLKAINNTRIIVGPGWCQACPKHRNIRPVCTCCLSRRIYGECEVINFTVHNCCLTCFHCLVHPGVRPDKRYVKPEGPYR